MPALPQIFRGGESTVTAGYATPQASKILRIFLRR